MKTKVPDPVIYTIPDFVAKQLKDYQKINDKKIDFLKKSKLGKLITPLTRYRITIQDFLDHYYYEFDDESESYILAINPFDQPYQPYLPKVIKCSDQIGLDLTRKKLYIWKNTPSISSGKY